MLFYAAGTLEKISSDQNFALHFLAILLLGTHPGEMHAHICAPGDQFHKVQSSISLQQPQTENM